MEENKNQVAPQTNMEPKTESKKNNNIFMLLIIGVLFVIFGVLIYAIKMNNEADYASVIRPANLLNPAKPVNTLSPQGQVEGTDSIDVGNVDIELQDLTTDTQGL